VSVSRRCALEMRSTCSSGVSRGGLLFILYCTYSLSPRSYLLTAWELIPSYARSMREQETEQRTAFKNRGLAAHGLKAGGGWRDQQIGPPRQFLSSFGSV
jgi:hypothetical protein